MNILLTNDDGVHAEGLFHLKNALDSIGKINILAPDRPRSACGHSITLHKPLRVNKVKLKDGSFAMSCSGTPTDCVSLALNGVVEGKVDLIVSGINHGSNLGWDLTYSGTVSAAMQGAISKIPSIAVSVASYEDEIDYSAACDITVRLAKILHENKLPENTLLNVNTPNLPMDKIKGVEITRQGKRVYIGDLIKRQDPNGREYYWLGGDEPVDDLDVGTDVYAVKHDKISITPVHLDLTDHSAIDLVKSWVV